MRSLAIVAVAMAACDVFPQRGTDSRAVIASVGTALYSGYLGYGHRRVFNPYLGARLGYGYLSGEHATTIAGELGIELYKQRYVLVEVSGRVTALFREAGTEAAFQGQLGFEIPF
jgi:hypothetical protein